MTRLRAWRSTFGPGLWESVVDRAMGQAAPPASADPSERVLDRRRRWDDAAVRYQTRLVLDGADGDSDEMRGRADEVRASSDSDALIEGGFVDPRHPYRRWQGGHWALVRLAERGHPGGDPRLSELQEVVFAWILSPAFLKPNWTR